MRRFQRWLLAAGFAACFDPGFAYAQETVPLDQVIPRALRILEADSDLPENQRNRLLCTLRMLRDQSSADDRYVPENFIVRSVNDRLTPEQLDAVLERVRRDLQRPIAFGADQSDEVVHGSLERLDLRIFMGIAYLNRVAGDGLAVGGGSSVSPGKIQLKDFVSERQEQRGSIYWCYGEGQDE